MRPSAISRRRTVGGVAGLAVAGLAVAGLAVAGLALGLGCSAFGQSEDDDEAPVVPAGGGGATEAGPAGTDRDVAGEGGATGPRDAGADAEPPQDGAPADFTVLTFDPGSNDCARLVRFGGATTSAGSDGSCRVCSSSSNPYFGVYAYVPTLDVAPWVVSAKVRSVQGNDAPTSFAIGLRAEGAADPEPSPASLSSQYTVFTAQVTEGLTNPRVVLVARFGASVAGPVCFEVDDLTKRSLK